MKMKTTLNKQIYTGLFAGLLLLGVSQSALASLVNGGFESGDLSNWNPSGNVGVTDGVGFLCCVPSQGTYLADFNGGNTPANGQISQSFATISGIEYLLTFDFGKGGGTPGTAALEVDVLGISSLLSTTVSDSTGGLPGAYQSYSFSFVADSISTSLSFRDVSTGQISSFDALLDNVSVNPVPIPAAIWLFGTAFIGLVGFSRRKAA